MDKPVVGDGSKSNSAAAAASATRHQTQYKNKGKDADVSNFVIKRALIENISVNVKSVFVLFSFVATLGSL